MKTKYKGNEGHFMWKTYGVSGEVDLIHIMFNFDFGLVSEVQL